MPTLPSLGTGSSMAITIDAMQTTLSTPHTSPPVLLKSIASATSVNASTILHANQRHTIQVLATATSSLIIAAALCALYWFCMMRRNFRRDIVLLLIVADLWRSATYLSFAAVTFANGPVTTEQGWCQASGYMLIMGTQMCGKHTELPLKHGAKRRVSDAC